MQIKDIKEEQKISLKALITRADAAKTQKNTPYLSLTLEDSTGILDAKFWNLTDEMVARYHVGQVVEAFGDIIIHRNAIQLRVRHLEVLEEESVADYVRAAPMSRAQMEEEIDAMIASIENEMLHCVVKEIIDANRKEYFTYPAAVKNHHNFVGGLAYHTLSMAKAALALLPLYPYLDKDLLLSGILLHDAAKIEEYTSPVLPEYSLAGNLVGHISLISGQIDQIAYMNDWQQEEDIILLKHMVLSHHGKQEYGSPVVPMIPEAEVLTLLDNLDSRLYMMKNTLDQTVPGTFSPRIFPLENRMVYHRKNKAESQNQELEETE